MSDSVFYYHLKATLFYGSIWTVMSLLTLWAVWGRGHWFLRQAVVLGAVWLVELTHAMPVIWFWLAEVTGVWLIRAAVELWRRRFRAGSTNIAPLQFQLRDVFLATILVAILLAVGLGARDPLARDAWLEILRTAGVSSVAAAVTYWLWIGGWHLALRLGVWMATFVVAVFGVRFQAWWDSIMPTWTPEWFGASAWMWIWAYVPLTACGMLGLAVGLAAIWPYAFAPAAQQRKPSWVRTAAFFGANAALALLAIPAGWMFLALAWPLPAPYPPPPGPNAYPELLLAAGRNKIDGVHELLRQPSYVPLDYSPQPVDPSTMPSFGYTYAFRQLARAQNAAGDGHVVRGEHAAAAEFYLDTMRLGPATAQGGLLVDALVGNAFEAMGAERLSRIVPDLDARTCRRAIVALNENEKKRENLENVSARDRLWTEHVYGWIARSYNVIDDSFRRRRWQVDAHSMDRQDDVTRTALLQLELALRAHELETGKLPESLVDLAPKYIESLPLDPWSGNSFIYRRRQLGYDLYSVGPNGTDDGGTMAQDWTEARQGGDVNLETFIDRSTPIPMGAEDKP